MHGQKIYLKNERDNNLISSTQFFDCIFTSDAVVRVSTFRRTFIFIYGSVLRLMNISVIIWTLLQPIKFDYGKTIASGAHPD